MKVAEEKIQEIRDANDIVEVIGEHVTLKKRGKSYLGLCPFHHEKTPSFHVDPVKGFFHCFGCGEGGTLFSFLMKIENIGFPEALRTLAKRANIDLPVYQEDPKQVQETELLYYVNQFACDFYKRCLHETKAGQKAKVHLLDRGFDEATIKFFEIGYAPNLWDGLQKAANKESVRIENLNKAGLVIARNNQSGYYDRFRGRLMFPIHQVSGRVIGFGGRILTDAKDQPKYINSPETAVYQKSRLLYGLSQSKTGIRREDRIILVEGYTDVMRLFEKGFDYCVATSGTALTQEQARLVARYSKNAILVYDGDTAGIEASIRGTSVLYGAGLDVRMICLPEEDDPASFLEKNECGDFKTMIDKAENVVNFLIDNKEKAGKSGSPEERTQIVRLLMEILKPMKDLLKRNLMIQEISERLRIEESLLMKQIRPEKQQDSVSIQMTKKRTAREQAEINLLQLCFIEDVSWRYEIFQILKPDDFTKSYIKPTIDYLYKAVKQNKRPTLQALLNHFSDNPQMTQMLSNWLKEDLPISEALPQLAFDCMLLLKESEIKKNIELIRRQMKEKQMVGESTMQLDSEWLKYKEQLKTNRQNIESTWKKIVEF